MDKLFLYEILVQHDSLGRVSHLLNTQTRGITRRKQPVADGITSSFFLPFSFTLFLPLSLSLSLSLFSSIFLSLSLCIALSRPLSPYTSLYTLIDFPTHLNNRGEWTTWEVFWRVWTAGHGKSRD